MAQVTVLGLGYIGLPTAAMLATHGHTVHGYDVNPRVIECLRRGEVHIEEPGLLAFVRDAIRSGRLVPTGELTPSDVYILCVPTPFHEETKKADLTYVEAASRAITPLLKKGDLVILESTVPARCAEDVVVPILETSGLDARRDLHVAHCPETVLPGNMIHELAHNARVIGGLTPEATEAAKALYATFVRADMVTTDATTAEFVKLIENTYRDVNIALANEISLLARKLGIDAREAIRIANKHPRVHLHQPGPGVGGHCIPVDPWFLVEISPEARLIRTAREVNDAQPARVAAMVVEALRGVEAPTIAVLGLAYKGNVDDVRESPAFPLIRLLKERIPGARIRVADPHVASDRHDLVALDAVFDDADCALLVTDHREFRDLDPEALAKRVRARLVVDTRGLLDRARWSAAGFRLVTL